MWSERVTNPWFIHLIQVLDGLGQVFEPDGGQQPVDDTVCGVVLLRALPVGKEDGAGELRFVFPVTRRPGHTS